MVRDLHWTDKLYETERIEQAWQEKLLNG